MCPLLSLPTRVPNGRTTERVRFHHSIMREWLKVDAREENVRKIFAQVLKEKLFIGGW